MKNQIIALWFVIGIFCFSVLTSASAQQNPNPCAADAEKLCSGVQKGEGRIIQCLKEHSKELSPACVKSGSEVKEKIHNFVSACKDDMQKLCEGTKPGGGRILQCLKQHEEAVSSGCKEQMTQAKEK